MRRFLFAMAGLLFAMLFVIADSAAQEKTFKGEITDEKLNCAQEPMKAPEDVAKNKAACIMYYAHFQQPPSKYVLYDAATKTTYQIDDQKWVEPFVGSKVEITGTESNKTIKMTGIKVDESAYKSEAKSS
jgi:hypothetical protein